MKKRIIPFIILLLILQVFQFSSCDLVDYTPQPPNNPLDPGSDTFTPEPVTGISVTPETQTMIAGEDIQLTAELIPSWATDRMVVWTSGDTNIATVDSSGLVSSISPGSVTISATSGNGGFTDICTITVNPAPSAIRAESVTLNKESTAIYINGTEQLTPTVNPSNATYTNVTWTSADENIATVSDSGLVTGISAGTVNILVFTVDGNHMAMCSVTVQAAAIPVQSVELNKISTSILVEGTEQLTAIIDPADASVQTVTWASEDTGIAEVTENGLVTGISAGTTTITVTTSDGSHQANCEVTVTTDEVSVESVSLNKTSTQIIAGSTEQLTAQVLPLNATNQNVSWSTSNESVATVNTTGLVSANAAGTANITVTTNEGGFQDDCTVQVLPLQQPVTNFEAVAGNGEINLSWDNPGILDHVVIRGSTTASPATPEDGTSIYSGTGETATHSPVANGTKYYYSVFAFDVSENYSTGITDDAMAVGSPGAISAGNGVTSIYIQWDPSSGGVESYELQYSSTGEAGSYTNIYTGTGLWYTHEELDTGFTFWYRVRAVNYSGASDYTTPNSGETGDAPSEPGIPALSLSATNPETEIDLSWTASVDVDYYEIQRTTDGTWSTLNIDPALTLTTYTDTGLNPDTTYYYQVRAVNMYGPSGYSTSNPITTNPPSVFVATTGDDVAGLGTRTNPYATIKKAIEEAASNGMVCVQQGTYNVSSDDSSTITIAAGISLYGGYNSSWVRESEPAVETLIQDTSTSAGTWSQPNKAIEVISSAIDENTVIDGFTIRGTTGVEYSAAIRIGIGSPTFSNNIIHGGEGTSRAYGVLCQDTSAVFKSNTVNGGDPDGGASYGFYIYFGNPVIHGNVINGGVSSIISAGILTSYSCAPIIYNNLIDGGTCPEANGIYIGIHSGPDYFEIYNNTINAGNSDTMSYGIRLSGAGGGVFGIVVNNLIYSENKPNSYGIWEDGDNDDIAEMRYNSFSGLATIFRDENTTSINDIAVIEALSTGYSDNTNLAPAFVTPYSDLHLAAGTDSTIRYGALNLSTDSGEITSLADHYNFDSDYDVDTGEETDLRPLNWSMCAYQY